MTTRKKQHIFLTVLVLISLLVGNIGQAKIVVAAPAGPTDESLVPHYFGPYPNWANSPQVLADAVVTIGLGTPTPVSYGNPLIGRAFATDYATAPGTLGPVFVVIQSVPLPAGTLSDFQIWNQELPGGSPTGSAGNLFHAYLLRPTGVANEYTVVYDSGELTVPVPAPSGEIWTIPVSPAIAVQTGDVVGFYGEGVPVDVGGGSDLLSYPAPAAPAVSGLVSLGVDPSFPIYSQDRTYSIAATVTPTVVDPGTGAEATATVDPKTGAISAITVTNPGAGYVLAPSVSISAPGVTPTILATATAQISLGVVNSILVNESGFGFTSPSVTLTGGNPTVPATALASGGVDDLILSSGGSGYLVQPIVEFSLPNITGGVQATGTATMDVNGVVDGVAVVNPGSGYTSAPTVTILDGNQVNPTAATAVATINIGQIDVISGGQGYDSAPVVDIIDLGGTSTVPATATANVAVKGAVTSITVTNPGAGYLTPGLKKFVDTLPGLGPTGANDLGQYIPIAVPDTMTYPGSDYYEIALVQYRMKFHKDLPATLLRGYVQLSTSVVPGNQVPLSNANLDPTLPDNPIAGYTGVDNPHYLGPTIVASKDRPVRILFRNLLPTGSDGNLFLPVDTSLMGAGAGPDMMMLDANGVPIDMAMDEGTVMDGVRNPMCGETSKPTTCYSENRATLHLHGGITPWISDGTPHQWTTPAGEDTAYPQGVSVSNVPDMPDPGPGALTFFYTNQQSARLMFYHDHAWGITRLNVYAGEAAGYLLTDPMEQSLISSTGALAGLGVGTPLVIQDKTFVPSPAKMAQLDPTWQYNRWGGEGSLWTPHVYMPAQNPGDPSGMSAFGRWMYGPWFWPPAKDAKYPPIANPYYDPLCDPNVQPFCEPALIPSTPNVSVGMEAFNDTPIVNGTAYPTTTVDPKAYRYRILNAANDRFWNLSWYVADPRTGTLSEVALNPVELAAAQTDPVVFPTPDTTWSPPGPNWIQIGTEGGFLPAPVVVPAHPTTWITDPTRFDVGNVDQHSLLLAPAERADVIVDFSQFRGKTLILYNDAPAAFPARVPGYDYYTGGPDLTPSGAPTTLPGYGPNTRTIMQVKVSNAAPAIAFDRPNTTADRLGALEAAFAHHADGSGVFESSVDPIIVGQAAYNSAYGTDFVASGWCNSATNPSARCDGFARIAEGSQPIDKFGFNTLLAPAAKMQIPFQPKGIHDEMNSANFDEWGRMTANLGLEAPGATPLLQNIILYPFVNPATEILDSSGMPSALDVTPISSAADGTQIWKITHNGVDTHPIHFHLYNVQVINRVTWDNIIIPPEPTELGWKDTVRISPLEDTIVALRPIVPVIPFGVPDSKRPLNPMMPIGARGSVNGPNGLEAGFNNTDALGNPIDPIINAVVDFDWEYVYHCHILSHEEMDMMRPVTVAVPNAIPDAPVLTFTRGSVILSWTDGTPVNYADPSTWANVKNEVGYDIERADVVNGTVGIYVNIGTALANVTTFTDNPPDPTETYSYRVIAWNEAGGISSNELIVPGLPKASTTVVTSSLNPSNVGDNVIFTAAVTPLGATGTVQFSIDGVNTGSPVVIDAAGLASFSTSALSAGTYIIAAAYSGDTAYLPSTGSMSQVVNLGGSSTSLASSLNPSAFGDNVTFTATVSPAGATGNVQFLDGATSLGTIALSAGSASLSISTLSVGAHTITAIYSGDAAFSTSTGSLVQNVGLAATTTSLVSSLNPSVEGQSVTFTASVFPDFATGTVQFTIDGANAGAPVTLFGGQAQFSTSTLTVGTHPITAIYSGDVSYTGSTSASLTQTVNPGVPAAPSNLVATAVSSTQINLTWTDNATNETGFTIQRATNPTFTGGSLNTITLTAPNQTSFPNTGRNPGTTYYYRVAAFNAVGASAWSNVASAFTAVPGSPTAPSNLAAVGFSKNQINLTWTDNASNETGFTIQRSANVNFTGTTTITLNTVDLAAYSDTGRQPNTTYYYRVRAFNAVGFSAWSNTASATTLPLAPPAAPSNLVATAFSPTQIDLSWTDNATNETGFTIQRSTSPAFTGTTTITLNAVDQVAYSNTGRQPNTTYYYRVRAFNADGFSAWSNTASATTPASLPAVPAGLTVTPGAPGSLNVAWTYTSNGAPGPITFTVQRSNTGTGGWTTVATGITATTINNAGLPTGATRYYRVRAVNANGNSAWSTIVSATVP